MVRGEEKGETEMVTPPPPWGQYWEDGEPSRPSEKKVMEAGAQGPALLWEEPRWPCPDRRRAGSKARFLLTAASTDALRTLGHSSLVGEDGMRRHQSCLH